MIPPLPIDVYPVNTLEGMIARKWVKMIDESECHTINPEPIREVIQKTRAVMCSAGWTPTYQHLFLRQLCNDLTELTECHPVTRQFISLLDLELESN
jgi:hypothetical protein